MDRLGQSHLQAKYHSIGKEFCTLLVRVPQAESLVRKKHNHRHIKKIAYCLLQPIEKMLQRNLKLLVRVAVVLKFN